jgi:hypothetical protein
MLGAAGIVFASAGDNSRGRAAIVTVLVAGLLVPAIAGAASTTRFTGKFSHVAGEVSFKLKRKHGERKVSLWTWVGFPVTCAEGATETGGFFERRDLKVEQREFAGRAVLRNRHGTVIGKAKVNGEFAKGYKTASGLFRVTGVLPGGEYTECDSGLRQWTASEAITPAR